MVEKYYIEGVTQDWLLKPGMVVYVEQEYNAPANRCISKFYDEISRRCAFMNLTFLYIPRFYEYFGYDLMEYMTGQDLEYPSSECTTHVLRYILPSSVVSQIKGPSLLFTGIDDGKLVAFRITTPEKGEEDDDVCEKWKDSILKILRFTYDASVNPVEKELFVDCDIPLKEMDDRVCNESEEKLWLKYKKDFWGDISKRVSKCIDTVLDEEEETHTRFRVQPNRHIPASASSIDEEIEEIKNSDVFNAAQKMVRQLLDKGYSQEVIWALFAPIQELSPIRITQDYRIFLTLYNKEIVLTPLLKAVYLFFLKYPEGVSFKNLPDFHAELLQLYRKFAIRGTAEKHVSTITDLVNPLGNSMNEKCSIIKKYITNLLDDSLAKHYYISGGKGELKRIAINPEMIIWE